MNLKIILIILASLSCSLSAYSSASCEFSKEAGYMTAMKSYVMPISGTISVPPDIPVGREIYRQKVDLVNPPLRITCTSKGQFYYDFKYLEKPKPTSSYSSAVYNTNVTGIGIKFTSGTGEIADFPVTIASPRCPGENKDVSACLFPSGYPAASWFYLIKTANTIAPGELSADSLPSVAYAFGQSGAMVDIYKIKLSGKLNITAPTCNITPASKSMTVNMGSHYIGVFSGKNTASQWKNISIQLASCGFFYGNSQGANTMATFNGSTVTHKSLNKNFLTITLTPKNGTVDAAKGIMKIDAESLKASGIGIQLAKSESASDLVNLAGSITQELPADGKSSITIPLYARYIQTENSVQPGKANGRLEYTITYQ